jgi:hypothetical protein
MAGNIGRARIKVSFLNKSPFSGQPKQEVAHYFSQDNVTPLSPYNIEAVPAPINGLRLTENLQNYDNFLSDGDYYIDEATYAQTVSYTDDSGSPSSSGSATKTVTTNVDVDPSAAARIKQLQDDQANASAAQKAANAAEKDFFTWVLSNPIFKDSPPPAKFADPPKIDNTPAWSLVALPRPGSSSKVQMLTPFMRKSPPDRKNGIHWGCKMQRPIAQNQPFELLFYYCQREAAVADQGPKLTPVFTFFAEDGQTQLDLGLHNSIYIAIEFGLGDANHHFLLIFQSEQEPALYQVVGKNAIRKATFAKFNSSIVFDPSHKYFTVKIEPVAGSLIIRSNVFSETPWIISTPPESPIFIGRGNIGLYSGNVQAGFAMRPVQYESLGDFSTPATEFVVLDKGSGPKCSTTIKGPGTVQQSMSYSPSGDPEVSMTDAERVNGSPARTFIEAYSGQSGRDGGVNRKITVTTREVASPNQGSGNDSPTKNYASEIVMEASDVTQGGGYVVKNGRSPYIWLARCEMDPAHGGDPTCNGDECDISCDVMSIDLSHNATSYNELSHNGTMRVLNKVSNRLNGKFDYRKYTNRAVYVRIEAWWEIGVGHDPGPNNRNIFEGICYGGTVETRADNEIITFKLEDYMSALSGSKFVLCPPYDGMAASLAVRDIVLQMGFPDSRILTGNTSISKADLSQDLGLSPARINQEPLFRFNDGTSYKDGILKIAKLQMRTIYFDRFGNFHYDVLPGGIFTDPNVAPSIEFFSSPIRGNLFALPNLKRIAWNMVSFTTLVNDVYNVIQINSVDKVTRDYLSAGIAYKEGISDPTARGFLGYRKHLMISDPVYGSVGAVNRAVMEYASRVFIPPISARFEIYGYTGMKPLDIISLDGQRLRIMNMTTHLSAAENTYWQTIEGEWFDSIVQGNPNAVQNSSPVTTSPSSGSPGAGSAYTGG